MATSDSDDFESADEEIEFRHVSPRKTSSTKWAPPHTTIGSDTDDDNDCISTFAAGTSWSDEISDKKCKNSTTLNSNDPSYTTVDGKLLLSKNSPAVQDISTLNNQHLSPINLDDFQTNSPTNNNDTQISMQTKGTSQIDVKPKSHSGRRQRSHRQQHKSNISKPKSFGATKLSKNQMLNDDEATIILQRESLDSQNNPWHKLSNKSSEINQLDKEHIPEELKSNKKFNQVFNNDIDGWGGLDNNDGNSILTELNNEIIIKPNLTETRDDNPNSSTGWGSWGVTSLLNTASVGVSTLTNSVSHGLLLLEESIGAPDPLKLPQPEKLAEQTDHAVGTSN